MIERMGGWAERFVVAIETIAKNLEARNEIANKVSAVYVAKNSEPAEPGPSETQETAAPAETFLGIASDDRVAIRKKLDEAGVEYNNRCSTGTLFALLKEQSEAGVGGVGTGSDGESLGTDGDDDFLGEAKQPEVAFTTDDVRTALIKVKTVMGNEKAREILNEVGGAQKLSEVAEENYAKLIKACEAEVI